MNAAAEVDDLAAKLQAAGISLLYVVFFAIYIYFFVIFFGDLSWFASYVDVNTWSFGQIVAITVWTQPLCEYFHLELRKSLPNTQEEGGSPVLMSRNSSKIRFPFVADPRNLYRWHEPWLSAQTDVAL